MNAVGASGWTLAVALLAVVSRLRGRMELVARAEHEVRGPVTAMALVIETLRRDLGLRPRPAGADLGARRAAARDCLDALDLQLERVRAGLADLQAARRGCRAALRPAALPLESLVRSAAAAWAVDSGARDVRLDWGAGPVTVSADRGRLAQVFGNLISNAVEHGGGPVEVRGRRDNGTVRVEVRDAGPGFSNRRVRTRRSGRIEGRGRGLAIAAEAVEEAGGALEVAKRQSGATVAVELPVAEP